LAHYNLSKDPAEIMAHGNVFCYVRMRLDCYVCQWKHSVFYKSVSV